MALDTGNVTETREGVRKLLLCASEMGKPVYRQLGFCHNDGWMELDLDT